MNRKANEKVVSAKADLLGRLSHAAPVQHGGRSPNHPARFWIITMLLVLIGLSTLKLR